MHGGLLLCGLTAEPCACHIAAVAVLDAAHVEQHTIAGLQHCVIRLVVGVGGIGTEGDDRGKARPFAAVGAVLAVDEGGNLAFGHAGLYILFGSFVHGVIDAGGGAHQRLLLGVLAGAAVIHAIAGQNDPHTGVRLHQRDQKPRRPLLVDAQRGGGVHHGGNLCHRGIGVGMPDGPAGDLRQMEQPVQKQHRLAVHRQIECQQPLIGVNGHPGQVPDALRVADDHLGQPRCAQGGAHTVNAFGFHEKCLLSQNPKSSKRSHSAPAGFIALLRYCWGLCPTMAAKRVEKLLSSPKPT